MPRSDLNTVTFHLLKDLSSMRHFYDSTIKNGIEEKITKFRITLTEEEKEQALKEIKIGIKTLGIF